MSFSFFGTFSTGQWEAFRAFTLVQKVDLQLRKMWLQKALTLNGIFTTEYGKDFMPISFSASPGSYAAKLLQAYRILGGVPEREMLLRTSDQPVFLTSGTETSDPDGTTTGGFSDVYSNGRRNRGGQRFDRDLGLQVEKLKRWQLDSIRYKREHLEFKIKRALDYSDQLQNEIKLIETLLGDGSGSVADQILQVELAMNTPGATNVVDNTDDVFGLFIGKTPDLTFKDAESVAAQEDERE